MYTITVQGTFPSGSIKELVESIATIAQVVDPDVTVTVSPFGTLMHELLEESLEVHAHRAMDIVKSDRVYAVNRPEHEACEAGTYGCSIDHNQDHGSCEGW